ncbi:MAG TPA: sensor domain-containing diguanylate cyclase, partial [Solirubrobacteraceae bacterium]|nr:sensor domain-containing diguanylate cyclase [Solirubrobacteraceae bacterium]
MPRKRVHKLAADASPSQPAGAGAIARLRARAAGVVQHQRSASFAVTGLLFVAGMFAAVMGARAVARSDRAKQRLSFTLASAEIASTLKLAIQQEEGLVVSASAYVAGNPRTTPAEFDRWVAAVRALQRYPELQDLGLIELVPARALPGFRARMLAQPILPASRQPTASRGTFQVEPAGRRADYCLAAAGVVRSQVATLPPGLDYCTVEPSLLSARDTGLSSYLPFLEGATTTLAVQTPVYAGGVSPTTVSARRATFLGWLGESLVPNVILREALQAHPNVAVKFLYRAGFSNATFTSGAIHAGAQRTTVDLHNGWTVESFAAAGAGGVFGDRNALALLIGGTLLSLLVSVLVFVLATGRTRALSLVREKTSELSYQAKHDNLTGLPNRALVIERAEEMLARGSVDAAFYVDVDGFKQINDRYGHAAGDELLRLVAERLTSVVRERDVVGRLGGDEFVVLLDSSTGHAHPNLVAERLVKALHDPVGFEDGNVVCVSASVGIAMGSRRTVDHLLRDADLALYAAKAAGKD